MSRVTDVLSVGQVLNVMCIGLDVRGNINLSLKATLPKPKAKKAPVEESAIEVQKPVSNVLKKQENKADQSPGSVDSSSSFVIRSATECDEEEKSSTPKNRTKTPVRRTPKVQKPINFLQEEQENEVDQSLGDGESLASILIRSSTEFDEEKKSSRPENHSNGRN